ncbi:uridine kinase [Nocardioides sp.]|uniref:uridine kinase family protein n=1 Tax=Nocardioides sp. TaxID=35761 RepID=UPI003514711E
MTPTTLDDVRALARRPATLGGSRLLCIDGPTGAGKSTLAAALAAREPPALVIATDTMLEGWAGLPGLAESVDRLLRPLAEGRPGRYRRWDWLADAWAEDVEVEPPALLVLEGVGSFARRYRDLVTALVWVDADPAVRRRRWIERDGEASLVHRDAWVRDEDALYRREGTRAAADLVVTT